MDEWSSAHNLSIPDSQIKYNSFCFGQFRYTSPPSTKLTLLPSITTGNKSKCQSQFMINASSKRNSTARKILIEFMRKCYFRLCSSGSRTVCVQRVMYEKRLKQKKSCKRRRSSNQVATLINCT